MLDKSDTDNPSDGPAAQQATGAADATNRSSDRTNSREGKNDETVVAIPASLLTQILQRLDNLEADVSVTRTDVVDLRQRLGCGLPTTPTRPNAVAGELCSHTTASAAGAPAVAGASIMVSKAASANNNSSNGNSSDNVHASSARGRSPPRAWPSPPLSSLNPGFRRGFPSFRGHGSPTRTPGTDGPSNPRATGPHPKSSNNNNNNNNDGSDPQESRCELERSSAAGTHHHCHHPQAHHGDDRAFSSSTAVSAFASTTSLDTLLEGHDDGHDRGGRSSGSLSPCDGSDEQCESARHHHSTGSTSSRRRGREKRVDGSRAAKTSSMRTFPSRESSPSAPVCCSLSTETFCEGMTIGTVSLTLTQELARVMLNVHRMGGDIVDMQESIAVQARNHRRLDHTTRNEFKKVYAILKRIHQNMHAAQTNASCTPPTTLPLGHETAQSAPRDVSDNADGSAAAAIADTAMKVVASEGREAEQEREREGGKLAQHASSTSPNHHQSDAANGSTKSPPPLSPTASSFAEIPSCPPQTRERNRGREAREVDSAHRRHLPRVLASNSNDNSCNNSSISPGTVSLPPTSASPTPPQTLRPSNSTNTYALRPRSSRARASLPLQRSRSTDSEGLSFPTPPSLPSQQQQHTGSCPLSAQSLPPITMSGNGSGGSHHERGTAVHGEDRPAKDARSGRESARRREDGCEEEAAAAETAATNGHRKARRQLRAALSTSSGSSNVSGPSNSTPVPPEHSSPLSYPDVTPTGTAAKPATKPLTLRCRTSPASAEANPPRRSSEQLESRTVSTSASSSSRCSSRSHNRTNSGSLQHRHAFHLLLSSNGTNSLALPIASASLSQTVSGRTHDQPEAEAGAGAPVIEDGGGRSSANRASSTAGPSELTFPSFPGSSLCPPPQQQQQQQQQQLPSSLAGKPLPPRKGCRSPASLSQLMSSPPCQWSIPHPLQANHGRQGTVDGNISGSECGCGGYWTNGEASGFGLTATTAATIQDSGNSSGGGGGDGIPTGSGASHWRFGSIAESRTGSGAYNENDSSSRGSSHHGSSHNAKTTPTTSMSSLSRRASVVPPPPLNVSTLSLVSVTPPGNAIVGGGHGANARGGEDDEESNPTPSHKPHQLGDKSRTHHRSASDSGSGSGGGHRTAPAGRRGTAHSVDDMVGEGAAHLPTANTHPHEQHQQHGARKLSNPFPSDNFSGDGHAATHTARSSTMVDSNATTGALTACPAAESTQEGHVFGHSDGSECDDGSTPQATRWSRSTSPPPPLSAIVDIRPCGDGGSGSGEAEEDRTRSGGSLPTDASSITLWRSERDTAPPSTSYSDCRSNPARPLPPPALTSAIAKNSVDYGESESERTRGEAATKRHTFLYDAAVMPVSVVVRSHALRGGGGRGTTTTTLPSSPALTAAASANAECEGERDGRFCPGSGAGPPSPSETPPRAEAGTAVAAASTPTAPLPPGASRGGGDDDNDGGGGEVGEAPKASHTSILATAIPSICVHRGEAEARGDGEEEPSRRNVSRRDSVSVSERVDSARRLSVAPPPPGLLLTNEEVDQVSGGKRKVSFLAPSPHTAQMEERRRQEDDAIRKVEEAILEKMIRRR